MNFRIGKERVQLEDADLLGSGGEARVYRWRAHSEGRYLETELKVTPGGFSWGYDAGPVKVANTMNLTPKGEWHEITEITSGNNPPRKTLDMTLKHVP